MQPNNFVLLSIRFERNFIIFLLTNILYFLIKIILNKNKRTFLVNFFILITLTILCISDRFSYFILILPTIFIYLLTKFNKIYINKKLFITVSVSSILFILFIRSININNLIYLASHLSFFSDFSIYALFKGVITPSPLNFLNSSSIPNTIDQILYLALPYNFLLFSYYIFLILRSFSYRTANNNTFDIFKFTFSWILINFIFFSIFNAEMLR